MHCPISIAVMNKRRKKRGAIGIDVSIEVGEKRLVRRNVILKPRIKSRQTVEA